MRLHTRRPRKSRLSLGRQLELHLRLGHRRAEGSRATVGRIPVARCPLTISIRSLHQLLLRLQLRKLGLLELGLLDTGHLRRFLLGCKERLNVVAKPISVGNREQLLLRDLAVGLRRGSAAGRKVSVRLAIRQLHARVLDALSLEDLGGKHLLHGRSERGTAIWLDHLLAIGQQDVVDQLGRLPVGKLRDVHGVRR